MSRFAFGVLLATVPLFSQSLIDPVMRNGRVHWFTLTESPKTTAALLGPPALVAESGSRWISWQYQLGDVAHEDFSHHLLFERGTGRLLSVTRNYETERDISALFPARTTTVHYFPNAQAPQLSLRVRQLPGGRYLTALGAKGRSNQAVLLRAELMPVLYPWVNLLPGVR